MNLNNEYWIVGKSIGFSWEIIGIYDSEEKALEACVYPGYFLGPLELNKTEPFEAVEWKGAYYPLQPDMCGDQ